YWDPDGELTGYQQFIGAMTLTAEYRVNIGPTQTLLRTEFRHDTSTGPQGGFYNASSATTQLVPNQNLLFFALIWSFDNPHE
ncbi:MAG: porin, partial [Gammaproteobacteria bacterium]|nr:porin [Gammaproteobacteria bacterium]